MQLPMNGGWIIETKQALKRLLLPVLVTIGNGLLAWSVPGALGAFFKVTAGILVLILVVALFSLLMRSGKRR